MLFGKTPNVEEHNIIRDSSGIVHLDDSDKYIENNPHLFTYKGYATVNEVVYHVYQFIE